MSSAPLKTAGATRIRSPDRLTDTFAAASGRSVLLITHRPEGLDLVDRVERIGEITLSGGSPA